MIRMVARTLYEVYDAFEEGEEVWLFDAGKYGEIILIGTEEEVKIDINNYLYVEELPEGELDSFTLTRMCFEEFQSGYTC